jgi:acetyl-CoA carboxylase carboxyl transferase beta subunit
MTERLPLGDLLDAVVDGGVIERWDEDLRSRDVLGFVDSRPYVDRLAEAAGSAFGTEAVVTGVARVAGREVVVIAGDFGFLVGTQGIVVGERVTRAFDRAATRGLPVLGLPTSGGTRMQEGSLAFVQMLKIAAAVGAFRRAGGRYVAWLRHPTTGGVLASWGSLAHVTWAQPGALLGLTGPRVVEAVDGLVLPPQVQRAEHLARHGIVDDTVGRSALRTRLSTLLDVLGREQPRDDGEPVVLWPAEPAPAARPAAAATVDGWTAVERTRRSDRPGVRDLLATAAAVERIGGAVADGCVTAVCRLRGVRVVVIAHDRAPGSRGAAVGGDGYRRSRRAMALAAALDLPLVTFVDTRGAAATAASESQGTAREIARCIATMAHLPVPTVGVLAGEGSGGGAIAWLAADRVIAAEHAWLAPIAPEGASAILHRSTDHAADLARAQAIDTASLRSIGVVDRVVAEGPGWIDAVGDATAADVRSLARQPARERLAARARRLRHVGTPA